MASIGYARLSIEDEGQALDRETETLKAAGCERTFEDCATDAHAGRPGLRACLDHLQRDDVLVVVDLDRLGRRAGELIASVDELDNRDIGSRALNTAFDTIALAGYAFLQIQAAFAEMERNLIRRRVSDGIAAARACGRRGGRPIVMTPERLCHARRLLTDRNRSIASICRKLGKMPASILYHYLHAHGSLKAPRHKLLEADASVGTIMPLAPLQDTTPSKVQRLHANA